MCKHNACIGWLVRVSQYESIMQYTAGGIFTWLNSYYILLSISPLIFWSRDQCTTCTCPWAPRIVPPTHWASFHSNTKTLEKIRDRLLSCCWFVNVYSEGVSLCCGDFLLNVCCTYAASDVCVCVGDLCYALKWNNQLTRELLLGNKWWGLQWCPSQMNKLSPLKTQTHTHTFQP